MCSPDKDLTQCLVHPKVSTWDRIRDTRLDLYGMKAKFGILPQSIPDYLALVGDSADGFPGLPGWGAKGTAAVLRRYGTIEQRSELVRCDQVPPERHTLLDRHHSAMVTACTGLR